MSIVMFVAGAIAAVVGIILAAAGIPVKEFSFGNTLILAGTVSISGGLIVIALGAVLAQLQRIADMLGTRPAARTDRTLPPFETSSAPRLGQGPGQIPFPPKPKMAAAETQEHAPAFADEMAEKSEHDTPMLHNPADSGEADETPLMPRQFPPLAAPSAPDLSEPPARTLPPLPTNGSANVTERPAAPPLSWRPPVPPSAPPRPAQPSYFDAMWPADRAGKPAPEEKPARAEPRIFEPKAFEPKVFEPKGFENREPAPRETVMRESVMREAPETKRQEPMAAAVANGGDIRPVPILKAGVIDGMGYTLYVDGSIEAELPNGTLRFASIGELREHLEQNA